MKKMFLVPIEPLKERYTEQWYRNIPEFFKKEYEVINIDGESLIDYVKDGTFLDINSTIFYKSEQLKKISKLFFDKKVNDDDIFFIYDLEFWGIEALKYLADLQNIKIKIYGFLHAASYTKEDFIEKCSDYGKYYELGWLKICDGIFVGTQYHKDAVIERRIILYVKKDEQNDFINKIFVTGNPLFKEDYFLNKKIEKKKQLIISNRFDWEKRPNLSLDFAIILKEKIPDLNIVICTSRPKFKSNKKWLIDYARVLEKNNVIKIYENLSKQEYHELLAESKIMLSNTIEENFGYCVIESCIFNTYPLCENKFSHTELLENDNRLLFNDLDEIVDKVENLLKSDFDVSKYANKYYNSLNEIYKIING